MKIACGIKYGPHTCGLESGHRDEHISDDGCFIWGNIIDPSIKPRKEPCCPATMPRRLLIGEPTGDEVRCCYPRGHGGQHMSAGGTLFDVPVIEAGGLTVFPPREQTPSLDWLSRENAALKKRNDSMGSEIKMLIEKCKSAIKERDKWSMEAEKWQHEHARACFELDEARETVKQYAAYVPPPTKSRRATVTLSVDDPEGDDVA